MDKNYRTMRNEELADELVRELGFSKAEATLFIASDGPNVGRKIAEDVLIGRAEQQRLAIESRRASEELQAI